MKKCINCHSLNEDDENKCYFCGTIFSKWDKGIQGCEVSYGEPTSENAVESKPEQYRIGIDSFERMKANCTKDEIIGACKLNIDKYIWRNKGSDVEDLKKAKDYIDLWLWTLENK